jgi:hypothetical protein
VGSTTLEQEEMTMPGLTRDDIDERTLAIRHVQEAVMFANAAIAIHSG